MSDSHEIPTTSRGTRRRGSWRTLPSGVVEFRLRYRDKATGRWREANDYYEGPEDGIEKAHTAFLARVDAGEQLDADMTVEQLLERWYRLGVDDWTAKT